MALQLAEIQYCVENPLKLRIIMLLGRNGPMTAKEILRETGASQTTLYRTLNGMQENRILDVVAETKIRAMTEKTYDLSINFKHFDVDLTRNNDVNGYCNLFSSFSLGLIRDFQEYADDPDANLESDVTGFTSVGIYVTNEEAKTLAWRFVELIEPYLSRTSPEQKLHTMAFVLTPPQKRDEILKNGAGTIGIKLAGGTE